MFPHDIEVRVHYASAYTQEAITIERVPNTGTKPREAVVTPSLEAFNTGLDKPLSNCSDLF